MAGSKRNALLQPYLSTSIWNLPIGNSAVYTPANLVPATNKDLYVDPIIVLMDPSQPVTDLRLQSGSPSSCGGTTILATVPIDPAFLVPAPSPHNYGMGAVLADGHTYVQGGHFAHCSGASYATVSWVRPSTNQDLFGDGLVGGGGGSGTALNGGVIRLGELVPGGKIPHVLQISVDAKTNLYYAPTQSASYRWPAAHADSYWNDPTRYGGTNPKLVTGALLALRPSFNVAGLKSPMGRIVGAAMQDYGVYIVNDGPGPSNVLCVEISHGGPGTVTGDVAAEFASVWSSQYPGITMQTAGHGGTDDWSTDIRTLYANLYIVDSNNVTNYNNSVANGTGAGGGTPRVPMAPPL